MIYDKQNRYDLSEVFLFECKRGPDGIYYPVTMEVIGHRRKINGQEVDPTGAPVPPGTQR